MKSVFISLFLGLSTLFSFNSDYKSIDECKIMTYCYTNCNNSFTEFLTLLDEQLPCTGKQSEYQKELKEEIIEKVMKNKIDLFEDFKSEKL